MIPTSLPELPKTSRTSGKSQTPVFLNPELYVEIQETSVNFLIHTFKGPISGGKLINRLPYIGEAGHKQGISTGGACLSILRLKPGFGFFWRLEGNQADSRKFLVENPMHKSGS